MSAKGLIGKLLIASSLAAGGLALASPANATTIIALQEAGVNGGAITTVASGSGVANFTGAYGTFSLVDITGFDNSILSKPEVLDSTNTVTQTSLIGTLNIFVATVGDTVPPTGLVSLASTLTANQLNGVSVTESTFYCPADSGVTCAGNLMFSAAFVSPGVAQQVNQLTLSNPYEVLEEFTINSTTTNNNSGTNLTIDISTRLPEPASIAIFGTALLGLGFLGLRRRRKDAA